MNQTQPPSWKSTVADLRHHSAHLLDLANAIEAHYGPKSPLPPAHPAITYADPAPKRSNQPRAKKPRQAKPSSTPPSSPGGAQNCDPDHPPTTASAGVRLIVHRIVGDLTPLNLVSPLSAAFPSLKFNPCIISYALRELKKDGVLVQVSRGTYRLASAGSRAPHKAVPFASLAKGHKETQLLIALRTIVADFETGATFTRADLTDRLKSTPQGKTIFDNQRAGDLADALQKLRSANSIILLTPPTPTEPSVYQKPSVPSV
jgi:hypothetical protein